MTMVVDAPWVADHLPPADLHTWPVRVEVQLHSSGVQGALPRGGDAQADCAPVAEPPTGTAHVSVEDRARGLCDSVNAKHFRELVFEVERYQAFVYWRSVLEAAAMEMTARGDAELVALAAGGLSAAKISQLLAEGGCLLSKSGVEQALKRGRAAQRRTPDLHNADLG